MRQPGILCARFIRHKTTVARWASRKMGNGNSFANRPRQRLHRGGLTRANRAMPSAPPGCETVVLAIEDLTHILQAIESGDSDAAGHLFPAVGWCSWPSSRSRSRPSRRLARHPGSASRSHHAQVRCGWFARLACVRTDGVLSVPLSMPSTPRLRRLSGMDVVGILKRFGFEKLLSHRPGPAESFAFPFPGAPILPRNRGG